MGKASDLEIARAARKIGIGKIGEKLGLSVDGLIPYGGDKGKVSGSEVVRWMSDSSRVGKLVLVTAINPTPAGEGKTTTTIGLGDGLNRIGKQAVICLREPSLGPCFGMKGGATGGGRAQVVPMEEINLHFTGDFHAVTSAHNLLAAMVDNHIHFGNELGIDTRRVTWRRVMDMNDRALRQVVVGLGSVTDGVPRQSGFDITVTSEIMAILCLCENWSEMRDRLANIIVGYRQDRSPVFCRDVKAEGAMSALLKDAFLPNVVQTLENNPAFVHMGPFANIAHGCNSVIATKLALHLSDFVVTEAGFGADLGAEKFINIKCRKANLIPSVVVIVATVRALKMSGGVSKDELDKEDMAGLSAGCENLGMHIENMNLFGMKPLVAINRFLSDSDAEIQQVKGFAESRGAETFLCTHWADGSAGIEHLSRRVVELAECRAEQEFRFLYPDEMPLLEKIETVAKKIYRASAVETTATVRKHLAEFEANGYRNLPVCIARTQYALAPGFVLSIREVRVLAGAGFVVAVAGDIMTMPGLPRHPAGESIDLSTDGLIEGLF